MKITFEGVVWDLDTAHIGFQHALAVQKQTGMSIADWEDSLDFQKDDAGKIANPPPEWLISVGALYWLMLAQNGEEADPATMDFDFTGFLGAYFEALFAELKAAADKAAEPDPTRPSPTASQDSPTSATPTATTPPPPAPQEGDAIAFT